jgi:uncharacterized protein YutE (UPF0331/DUF86 family)
MADDVLLNKAATIERCIARAREEYVAAGSNFAGDFTRQDAAILNIQRVCEAALDVAYHLIRVHKLGLPQSARDAFELLAQAKLIAPELAEAMKKMAGFRNIAVHDYQKLLLPITENIIQHHLDEFTRYTSALIKQK